MEALVRSNSHWALIVQVLSHASRVPWQRGRCDGHQYQMDLRRRHEHLDDIR